MTEMHTDEEIQAMSQDRPDVAGWMAWGRRFGWRCVGTALGTATFDLPSGERQIISGEARDTISAALPEPMTDDDLKAIRERVEEATPGPWERREATVCAGRHNMPIPYEGGYIDGAMLDDREAHANAAFIADSRTDVVRLLDEVERFRKENAAMKAMIYAATVEAINASGAETARRIGGRGVSPDDLTPIPTR